MNDPEGDEDLADDISVHELDTADDEDYDATLQVHNARRVIVARLKKNKACGCDTDKVEARILNQIKRDKKLTGAQLMTLMRDVYRATRQSRSLGQLPMCKSHVIILASKIGLKTAGLGIKEMWSRIITACQRPNDIGDLKLALTTMHWFTAASKALAPSDYLGIYRFPNQERKRMPRWDTQYRLKVAEHYLKRAKLQEWHDDGTVHQHTPNTLSTRRTPSAHCAIQHPNGKISFTLNSVKVPVAKRPARVFHLSIVTCRMLKRRTHLKTSISLDDENADRISEVILAMAEVLRSIPEITLRLR